MTNQLKSYRLPVLFVKLLTSVAILVCLFCPTVAYRKKVIINNGTWQTAFNGIVFRTEHHFCKMPEIPAVVVNSDETRIALDLPKGSHVDEHLVKFGECRAKLSKMNKDLLPCSCNTPSFFIPIFMTSVVSTIVQAFRIVCRLRKKSNKEIFTVFFICVWFAVANISAVAYYVSWFGEFWLPDAMCAQPYFQGPVTLLVAVILCYFYVLLCIVEVVVSNSSKEIESKNVCQEQRTEQVKQSTLESLRRDNFQFGNESETLKIESGLNDVANDINIDAINAYSRYSQNEIETLIFEPLPRPKLANFEMVPKKPIYSASWP